MDANRDPRTYIWRGSDIYGNTIQYALTQRDANDSGNQYACRAVIDPDADATSRRHLHPLRQSGRPRRSSGRTQVW